MVGQIKRHAWFDDRACPSPNAPVCGLVRKCGVMPVPDHQAASSKVWQTPEAASAHGMQPMTIMMQGLPMDGLANPLSLRICSLGRHLLSFCASPMAKDRVQS